MAKCDKCAMNVDPQNDATHLDALRLNNGLAILLHYARHLLPVYDDCGVMLCAGSPSRAQYLEGMPRDNRFPYSLDLEIAYRRAYALLQEPTTA